MLVNRRFTCALRRDLSSKRKLVTSSAYRPSNSLDQIIPSLSSSSSFVSSGNESGRKIAIPGFNDIRPPVAVSAQGEGDATTTRRSHGITEPDTRTTTTKISTTTPSQSIQTSETTSKPQRPRLRPRKAALNLTPAAVAHLKTLLALPDPKLIRIGVKNRGCSGLAYHLEYVEKPGSFDELVEQDGVRVLIDSRALFSIIGSEMDWVDERLEQRFVFRNPNISMSFSSFFLKIDFLGGKRANGIAEEQCGCGESFMV